MPVSAQADVKLITCVLPKGSAKAVLEGLHGRGILTANAQFARGADIGDPIGKSGLPNPVEKEILTVVVREKEAAEMFEYIYGMAQIDRPGGGLMYVGDLRKSVPFVLPDLSSEAQK